jgi:hypothetical protein
MTKIEKTGRKPAFLTIFICILLALALLFGIVFGVINIVKYSGALVYYGDTVITENDLIKYTCLREEIVDGIIKG